MSTTAFRTDDMYLASNYKTEGVHINTNEEGVKAYVFVNKKVGTVFWLGKYEQTKHIFDYYEFRKQVKDPQTELEYCRQIFEEHEIPFDKAEILSKRRKLNNVFKRRLVAFILKRKGLTSVEIGRVLGFNHSTVLNLLKYDFKTEIGDRQYNILITELLKHRST